MLKIIAAVAENGVIGRDGTIPWKLRDDMKWFKDKTGTSPVVMGRKTFNSLPDRFRPLPNRLNIILTRNRLNAISEHSNLTFEHDFDSVIARSKSEDVWVIGGADIYDLALPHAQEILLTRVHTEVDGDVFFPEWNPEEWELVSIEFHYHDERNEFPFTWEIYRRKIPVLR